MEKSQKIEKRVTNWQKNRKKNPINYVFLLGNLLFLTCPAPYLHIGGKSLFEGAFCFPPHMFLWDSSSILMLYWNEHYIGKYLVKTDGGKQEHSTLKNISPHCGHKWKTTCITDIFFSSYFVIFLRQKTSDIIYGHSLTE